MHIHDLGKLIEFDETKFIKKVLTNRPGYRLLLLNLRKGQNVPEHAVKEVVTAYAIGGRITFFERDTPYELNAGEVLFIEGGVPHALMAHENSTLLIVVGGDSATKANAELDLRQVPRPQRHPLVFAKFDSLEVGQSFELINDHDPVPLNRQIDALRPGQAEWSYVVRGPETFRIRVRRIAPMDGPAVAAAVQPQELFNIPG
jgi:uncharacterized protein (DUF2249 family)/mannose-6-phosphate isomerase-like protein (cupin superfamily)